MRAAPLLAFCLLVTTATACSALFEDAVQCTRDSDCERFSATCDAARGVCARRGSPAISADGGGDPDRVVPDDPSAPDSSTTPSTHPCDVADKPRVELTEIAASMTLSCEKDYVLKGVVYVRAGATLTIPAGTRVLGDIVSRGGLYVQPGGKLVAEGSAARPVVFTSSQPADQKNPGDWRGLILLGKAPGAGQLFGDPALTWGGADAEDSSGVLRYVRVEYAGYGVKLAGVGRGTTIDSVQVRKSNDNCFEIMGGTVNGKHLACQYPADDAFEWSSGYDGAFQFLVAQRTPILGSDHHGVLVDRARVVLSNVTLCGAEVPNEGYGLVVRDGGTLSLSNALVMGWAAGADYRGTPSPSNDLRAATFFGNHAHQLAYPETVTGTGAYENDDNGFDEASWMAARSSQADPKVARCFDPKAPSFVPQAAIDGVAPSGTSFDTSATFVGGVGAGDVWTSASWLVWDSR